MYKSPKHVCLVVFFLVMLSMALPATAQDAARVELSGGYNFLRLFDEDLGDEKNFAGGWYGEVAGNLTDMFAIVGQVGGNYKTLTFDNTDFDFNLHVFSAGVRVSSRTHQRVVPFAHILGGGVRSSLKGGGEEESWTDGFLLIGGGVNVMPNARVGIRLGADYVRAFTEDEGLNVFRFAAGIVLPFGSR